MSEARIRNLLALAEELDGKEAVEEVRRLLASEGGLAAAQTYLRELVDELVKDPAKRQSDYLRIGPFRE